MDADRPSFPLHWLDTIMVNRFSSIPFRCRFIWDASFCSFLKLGALQDLEGGKRIAEDLQNMLPLKLAATSQVRGLEVWDFL